MCAVSPDDSMINELEHALKDAVRGVSGEPMRTM